MADYPEAGQSSTKERLWPPRAYRDQVSRLRSHIGEQIHLVELDPTNRLGGASLTGKSHRLLALVDFPEPDPQRRLFPHMVLLDDGRGINLGRLARISRERGFSPSPDQILYLDSAITQRFLTAPQRFSRALLAQRSREFLARFLGAIRQTRLLDPVRDPNAANLLSDADPSRLPRERLDKDVEK